MVRGEVFRLPAPRGARGHEQRGARFAVVVQADEFLDLSTVLVSPTSASAQPASAQQAAAAADTAGQAAGRLRGAGKRGLLPIRYIMRLSSPNPPGRLPASAGWPPGRQGRRCVGPAGSVTVSDGDCPERTRADPPLRALTGAWRCGHGDDRTGNLSARCVLAVMIGARRGRVSERKLRRESLPIANGARESCAASRFMESSALWSSRDVRFDAATLDDRQDAQRTRTGRTRS